MQKIILAALGAATMAFSVPVPAQELPLKSGEYWDVTAVTVNDGHFPDYADFLAGEFRKRNDFSVSKGWIKGYRIFSNINARDDEPDLYLVTIFDHVQRNERLYGPEYPPIGGRKWSTSNLS